MALTDLSELSLLNIFKRLPVWKILQLSSLCQRLNNIKREVFRKQTQLRLLGGCRTSRYHLGDLKKYIHTLDVDQNEVAFNFDLTLKFDHSPNTCFNRRLEMFELSHDIHVRNLDQITEFAQMFPDLKKLTIAFTYFCEPHFLVQLLRNWPTLTHLYFVDFQSDYQDSLEYDNSIMEINNLHDLHVLAIHLPEPRSVHRPNWPLKLLEPLLQNSTKLHTLYFPAGIPTGLAGRHIKFEVPFNPQLNASLQIPFDRFERFGLLDYWPEVDENHTNEQFTSRTTRLEVKITEELRQLVNWSALQYLSLSVNLKDYPLSDVFDTLSNLHNLHEFHLINFWESNFHMPLESLARQLPQLPSVRRFEFCSMTSPYELYRFKWALPNAAELRLKLANSNEFAAFKDLISFCASIKTDYGDTLSESCFIDMKGAFRPYGNDIQQFYWIYYRNGRNGDGVEELVPMVERCTKMISGMRRLNFDLEKIGPLSID